MKKTASYIILCVLLLTIAGCGSNDDLPDLNESYSYKDSKPFGTYIAKKILDHGFPENTVQVLKKPFTSTDEMYTDTSSVLFSIGNYMSVDEPGVESLLDYIYRGNTAFFAISSYDTILLNKLYCKTSVNFMDFSANFTDFFWFAKYKRTSVRLVEDISSTRDSFSYFYYPFNRYFSEINDRYCRIVGYNSTGKADCIVFFWGKGKLFLHTEPRAFSNYFLLKDSNYRYMQDVVNLLGRSPQHVFWDDYNVKLKGKDSGSGNGENKSTLSEIFKHIQLQTAFWLLLLMLLLYLLFGGKRKQRIIREIKPNQNSSVAFTETVARLYLQQHDNKNIADKMITYFYEFIRSNYFLNANTGSKEFITALSRKSGVPEEKTISLFRAINHANENTTIDDYQLLSLNEQIQLFYKKRR